MESFEKEGIVTEIIDHTPPTCLQIQYGDMKLNPGEILTPTKVKDVPQVNFDGKEGEFFTLIMLDPDAPSRQNQEMGEINHWLVANIPGNDISKGDEIMEYIGSGPPQGSGLHRYIFVLFKQTLGKTDFSQVPRASKTSIEGRRQNKVRAFAEQHKLQLVAGNFYQAEYDDYTPILHAQLGIKPQQK